MFVMDAAPKRYREVGGDRGGWGRVLLLALGLALVSAPFGSASSGIETVVVRPGDTIWAIALAHYPGDPRSRVDEILRLNHLASPLLRPGQSLRIPAP